MTVYASRQDSYLQSINTIFLNTRSDLNYVNYFCDTEAESGEKVSPEMTHNIEAPTIHNLHCKGK